MEKTKVSKRALESLLNDSIREAIANLQLPEPTKKVNKVVGRSAKKLAGEFASILKKENKKAKKAEKSMVYVDEILSGKKSKKSATKKEVATV
jgi:hypothetical protein